MGSWLFRHVISLFIKRNGRENFRRAIFALFSRRLCSLVLLYSVLHFSMVRLSQHSLYAHFVRQSLVGEARFLNGRCCCYTAANSHVPI